MLGSAEWPAAELLLRALLLFTIEIAEKPKSPAPAKNMALELLGLMGSAISELVSNTYNHARSLENQDTTFSGKLRQLLDDYMDGRMDSNELLGLGGPYHVVVQHLDQSISEDLQTKSAQVYYITQWAKAVSSKEIADNSQSRNLISHLQKSLVALVWTSSE